MKEKITVKRMLLDNDAESICHKHVREADAQFKSDRGEKYGQAVNAIAFRRALLELFEGKVPEQTNKQQHARFLAVCYFFGNASAVRQTVLEKKEKVDELAADYSDIA